MRDAESGGDVVTLCALGEHQAHMLEHRAEFPEALQRDQRSCYIGPIWPCIPV